MLRVDQGSKFRKQHPADRSKIALPLQHAGEPRQVSLQPVLFRVALRREAEIIDHRVDVVFEFRDFAARLYLDRTREVTFGYGGGHFSDRANLVRKVVCQKVYVSSKVLPGTGRARNVSLTSESAFYANFARNRGYLVGKRSQRVRHVIDGFGKRCDFTLRIHR